MSIFVPVRLQILSHRSCIPRLAGQRPARKTGNVRRPDIPYECGMISQGEGSRLQVKYLPRWRCSSSFSYRIVFMYPLAVATRPIVHSSSMIYWSMLSFIAIAEWWAVVSRSKRALPSSRIVASIPR